MQTQVGLNMTFVLSEICAYNAFFFLIITGLTLPEKEPTRYFQYEDDTPQRQPLTDLTLDDLSSDSEICAKYFDKNVKPFAGNKKKESQSSIFEDISKMGKGLCSLKITPERVAKVVPDRIFSLAIHPTNSKLLIAAGGKWGNFFVMVLVTNFYCSQRYWNGSY